MQAYLVLLLLSFPEMRAGRNTSPSCQITVVPPPSLSLYWGLSLVQTAFSANRPYCKADTEKVAIRLWPCQYKDGFALTIIIVMMMHAYFYANPRQPLMACLNLHYAPFIVLFLLSFRCFFFSFQIMDLKVSYGPGEMLDNCTQSICKKSQAFQINTTAYTTPPPSLPPPTPCC